MLIGKCGNGAKDLVSTARREDDYTIRDRVNGSQRRYMYENRLTDRAPWPAEKRPPRGGKGVRLSDEMSSIKGVEKDLRMGCPGLLKTCLMHWPTSRKGCAAFERNEFIQYHRRNLTRYSHLTSISPGWRNRVPDAAIVGTSIVVVSATSESVQRPFEETSSIINFHLRQGSSCPCEWSTGDPVEVVPLPS